MGKSYSTATGGKGSGVKPTVGGKTVRTGTAGNGQAKKKGSR